MSECFSIKFNYQCLDFIALVTPCEQNGTSIFKVQYAIKTALHFEKTIEIYPLPGDGADLIKWKEYSCADQEKHSDSCLIEIIGEALENTDSWVI
jgi:hypothetical protein